MIFYIHIYVRQYHSQQIIFSHPHNRCHYSTELFPHKTRLQIVGLLYYFGVHINIDEKRFLNGTINSYLQYMIGGFMDREITPKLTKHQIRVLRLVAHGLTNRQIADFLKIKERTVEFHLNQIFQRLEVSSRTTATLKAERLGLLNRIYRR